LLYLGEKKKARVVLGAVHRSRKMFRLAFLRKKSAEDENRRV